MNPLLRQLIQELQHGPEAVDKLIASHASNLTPELAAESRQLFHSAAQAGNFSVASEALIVGSLLYMRLGDWRQALRCWIDQSQLQFMAADGIPRYEGVRTQVLGMAEKAQEIESYDLAFEATAIAADCAFFAAEVAEREKQQQVRAEWLKQCLHDLTTASDRGRLSHPELRLDRFVNLLAAAVRQASEYVTDFHTNEEFRCMLSRLAQNVESLVPVDFAFSVEQWRGNESSVASALARLSYEFGSASSAHARLDTAIHHAMEARNLETWLSLTGARYRGTRQTGGSPEELARQRDVVYQNVALLRGQFRSRTGRLWASQILDPILGEFWPDELTMRDGEAAPSPSTSEASGKQAVTVIASPKAEQIHATMEAAKARLLLDQLLAGYQDFANGPSTTQVAEMERAMLRWSRKTPENLFQEEMWLVSRLPIGMLWDSSRPQREALARIEEIYASHHAGFTSVANPARLAEIRAALGPGELLVEYFIPFHPLHPGREIGILAATAEKAMFWRHKVEENGMQGRFIVDGKEPMDTSALLETIVELRASIRGRDDAGAEKGLRELHDCLVAPLVEAGLAAFRHWIIVPHGPLHYVPFSALTSSQGRRLVEDVAITTVPSASVWLQLQKRAAPPVTRFLGLANPSLPDGQYPAMPAAEKGLAAACRIFGKLETIAHTGREANLPTLRSAVAGSGIVSIATHGEFPEEDVLDFHRLVLASTDRDDGRLLAEEARRLDFRAARLVILCICNGGLYRFGPGDEPYGLIPALFSAGAQNVLAPLWPVEDETARFFMEEFYRQLLKSPPAEALRATSLQFLQDGALLSHWCGFVMSGPGQAML